MAKIYIICLFISWVVLAVFPQKDLIFPGNCPSRPRPKSNFNEGQFGGKWYEISRFQNRLIPGHCGLADYRKAFNGFFVNFTYTILPSKQKRTLDFELRRNFTNSSASYSVFVNNKKESVPQLILETDYTRYGIAWGCVKHKNNTNTQRLSILSRNKTIDARLYNTTIINFLKNNNIYHPTLLETVNQNDKVCGRSGGSGGSGGGSGGNGSGGGSGGGKGGSSKNIILPSVFTYLVSSLLIRNIN